MSTPHVDVVVIGGGIVGLAHAWMAALRGRRVVLLERTPRAEGASVRNFGMIWPIGQATGDAYAVALRARELWLELGGRGVLPVDPCGSIHLAHRADEAAVHEEFRDRGTHPVRMLAAAEIARLAPLAETDGLISGLWSETELRVDPRSASARIAAFLAESHGVAVHFGAPVVAVDDRMVRTSDGRVWRADRIVLCSGSDLRTLFPAIFEKSGLILCKLQMLRTAPLPASPAHLASGLTLRHYPAFRECPSLTALKARVAAETPELDRFGIHVMASQFPGGEVVLGDSHEYGDDITPFDKVEIDELIIRECRKVFRLDGGSIRERWHGVYAKHPDRLVFEKEVSPGVNVFVGTGGAGMTMAFGLADRAWERW